MGPGLRATACAGAAAVALVTAAALAPPPAAAPALPPNIILIVTDDQTAGSLVGFPRAMPWLGAQLDDPSSGWVTFSNAVVSTPVCCPSRATILTGLYADRTGVSGNRDGNDLDESDTLPVWLRAAGYRTALVGKYLNGYPWDRGPYVPPGWDRWFAKLNRALDTTYYGYDVIDQGRLRVFGRGPGDYATDVLAGTALEFVRDAPRDQPWFLLFAPSAPHPPRTPAPRHAGVLGGSPPIPDLDALNDVEGKPAWVRALPEVDAARAATLAAEHLRERETLLAVDEAIRDLMAAVAWRGELDRTVVVFVSDNGYLFGEHRITGKAVPYEGSIHVPLAIWAPWSVNRIESGLVSNADVAPTIADLAGVEMPAHLDGSSLEPALVGEDLPERVVPLLWEGSPDVPPWVGVRTRTHVFIRHDDGSEELYDLVEDPQERRNLIGVPETRSTEILLRSILDSFLLSLGGPR